MTDPAPSPIDLATWPRREHFEHYRDVVPCTYAATVDVDVTAFVRALREHGRKTYPAQIWALATAVNRHPEFRMTLLPDRSPAVWDVVHPGFTVFNPDRETFSAVWVPYDPDFDAFHAAVTEALVTHRGATAMFPGPPAPPNAFDVSSLPRTTFSGFTIQVGDGWDHLLPIFTIGRHHERDGRTLMPLAVQVHHAAADGFHTSRLISDVEQLLAEPSWLGVG
ncbi:CatA-like O-acetyltransferase [Curtobacterium sp. 9128]|uniref:CatA-like O-acetyltransferase n=1 Tax=Curtobacterium sp. 9128 TaxID=1793722 RepID=UPI0011A9CCA2|nr:CatA-like O-acetyltransferase [Curtobacterium sp. 9128]